MNRSLVPLVAVILIGTSSLAEARQPSSGPAQGSPVPREAVSAAASPTPPSTRPSARPTPSASGTARAGVPIVVYLPNPIVIKSSSEGKGGDSGSGWLALLGIVVTAAVSIFLGYKSGQDAEQARSATSELAKKEREVKVNLAQLELAIKQEQFNADLAHKKQQASAANAQAHQKLNLEMERLGVQVGTSDSDAYIAAARFVHEQHLAEAGLIHSFSENLLSDRERERSFALFVLSAYVSPEVIGRIAAAGKVVISDESLKMLATIDDPRIASVAKIALERRKASPGAQQTEPPAPK